MHIGATCTQPHCPRDTPCRESRYRRDAHQNIGQPLGNGCRREEGVIGRILTPVGQGTVGRVSQADIRRSSEQRTGVLLSVRARIDSGLQLEDRLRPPPPPPRYSAPFKPKRLPAQMPVPILTFEWPPVVDLRFPNNCGQDEPAVTHATP